MRPYLIIAWLLAATSAQAQGLDFATFDLSFGSLRGDSSNLNGTRAAGETIWDLGVVGLQLGASADQLGDDTGASFRAILTRDLRWPVRLGLSAAYASNDGVQDNAATFGFHALYRGDWSFLELNLLLPNHIRETGAFSFNISGEQWLTSNLSIKTDLYRRSTDIEDPDIYTISLRLNYVVNDDWTVFAQGFQTVSDDYDIKSEGTHLGVEYRITPSAQVTASLDSLRPQVGEAALGLTVGVLYDVGARREDNLMFQTAILHDRFALGAF
jgi:hypothetical protein